ncbi:MAG: hypothetical protein ACM3Q2_19375 [Syntrophothermus sp.]
MKRALLFLIAGLFLFAGCSKEDINSPSEKAPLSYGSVSFSLDKTAIPYGVAVMTAQLSRAGADTLAKSMNLLTDTSASVSFSSVLTGKWHLKVEAKGSTGTVLYSGETDLTVNESQTTNVNLVLNSTGLGVGSVNITVTWGNISKWKDYILNPLMRSTDSPALPIGGVSTAKVIYENGIYKMWYLNTLESGHGNIGYAESQNGINWYKVGNDPVMTPGAPGSWDDYTVGPGSIIKENGFYRMYYIGWHGQYEPWHIGMATSTDGKNWQKHPAPIIEGTNPTAQLGVTDALKYGSTYYLFYTSRDISGENNSLNVATSTDGVNFIKYSGNPIITASQSWESSGVQFPTVIFEDGQFQMLYMNRTGSAFGLATSADGFSWKKFSYNPVFKVTDVTNGWCDKIAYPYWKKLNGEYRLYYTGMRNNVSSIALAVK